MRGTSIAHTHARLMGSVTRLIETPNAVVAAIALSACVTGLATWVVVSTGFSTMEARTLSAVDVSSASEVVRPVERATMRRVPEYPATSPDILGFADPSPARSGPGSLTAPPLEGWTAPHQRAVTRVIAGRPSVVPPLRPERTLTALAPEGLQVITRARGIDLASALSLPTPAPRPAGAAPITDTATASLSQRPQIRPVTLSTRSLAVQSEEIVLAAASVEAERPAPRLSRQAGTRSGSATCSGRSMHDMPRRPGRATDGSAVMAAVGNGSGSNRDAALADQAIRGNMPAHLRSLQPVTFDTVIDGRRTQITICVTPDYLAVGSDADHVRVPMGLPAALRVADAFDMMLPTTRMVDAIFAQADVRVSPQPMTPGNQMSSTDYFLRHDRTIDAQMASAGARGGMLVAGHKKDLVLANRLSRAPGRVAIYGWHRGNGRPIQPLSTVHGEYYADYSHGIRLVSRTAFVDGRRVDLRSLLTDGRYAEVLNGDGPLTSATIRLAALQ